MTINEFIIKYRNIQELKDFHGTEMENHFEDGIMRRVFTPYVICNDDFEFSCQASSTHYSEPRGLANEYTQVEIGFPSLNDRIIEKYREDYGWEEDCGLTNPVYPYVPVKVVDELIEFHCGINESAVCDRIAQLKKVA
jgi:isocitrate dehydrogenase kinase/phosphatase